MRIITENPQASQQGEMFNWQFVLTIVLILAVFYLFRRMSRNAAAKQEEARNSWFVVGANVVTASGFLGKIVDIDGDAVTLESPSGDETVWVKQAISQPMEIPLADVSESEASAEHAEERADSEASQDAVSDTDTADTEESTQA